MKTSLWGSSAWKFLHAATFAYPDTPTEAHKTAALEMFRSLSYMLPCGECCMNYQNEFSEQSIKPFLNSRSALSRWLVDLHNRVNKRLGKPELEYKDVQAMFPDDTCDLTCHDSPKHKHSAPLWLFIPLLFLGLLVIYLYTLAPTHKFAP